MARNGQIQDSRSTAETLRDLSESPRHLKALFDQSAAGIAETDREGRFLAANDRYCAMVGRGRDELLALRMQDITHPDDVIRNLPLFQTAVERGEPFEIEKRYVRPDGSHIWVNNSVAPIRDGDTVSSIVAFSVDITNRKQAEEALRQSEKELQSMSDAVPALIAYVDRDLRYRFVNAAYERWFEQPRNALLGRTMEDLLGSEAYAVAKPFAKRALAGERVSFERPFYGPGDNQRIVLVNYTPDIGLDGAVAGFHTLIQDITDRKNDEIRRSALLELADRFRELDDPADLAFAAAEILGRTLQVSRAGYGTIDRAAETITIERDWNAPGIKSLAGVLHFRDYGSYIEDLKRGDTVVFADAETDPRTASSAAALKAISAQAVVNMPITEQGGIVALLYLNHATAREWTKDELALVRQVAEHTRAAVERRRTEHALKESEQRFRNMADHAPVMMWVTNPDGCCTYLNRSWYEFTGQTPSEGEGFGWLEAVHPDDREWSGEVFVQSNARQEPFRAEYRLRRHDGAYRWAIDAAAPRFGGNGEYLGYVGSVIDIEERKREESLRAAENRVLQLAIEDRPLSDTLNELVRVIEQESDGNILGSILLLDLDRKRLLHGAAPSLPDAYNRAIDGIEIGEGVGSCGTAAHRGTPVFVSDITTDPLWKDFKGLATGHGLRACWSIPIVAGSGAVLGTFAMYHSSPRDATDEDLRLVGTVTRAAALIIERDRAEQALLSSEERFRAVFENAGVGLLLIDGDWTIVEANQRYCSIVGRAEGELLGISSLAFTHEDDLEHSLKSLQSIRDGGQISLEKRYLGKDGSIIWVRSNLARISGEDGAERYLKIIEDVTERRAAELSLQEERRTLETLNTTAAAIAGELELEKLVQMVTDAGVELTGAQFGAFFYNVTNDAGDSYMLFTLSGADRSQFERFGMPRNTAVFAPTFEGTGVVRSADITKDSRYGKNAPHKGMPKGHLPVRSYLAVPVRGRAGEVIGGLFFGHSKTGQFTEAHEGLMVAIASQAAIAMDNARLYRAAQAEIEQRVQAEQRLTELNESLETRVTDEVNRRTEAEDALRQAQKMETIGQLSGGIAHDFNNLLQIITGNLDVIRRSLPADSPRLARSADNAMKGAERAAVLTQRLLAFSRRQPLAPKVIDPNKLVSGMSELLHRTLGEMIEIETVLGSGLWRVEVDPIQLETALLNLAVNSRDAMPDGGKLTIETCNTHLDRDYAARNAGAIPGQYVVICVSDTGIGMDEKTADQAFDPFFTTKEVGKGTGLGLSMVYGFVKQSGGHLKIYSEVDEGTTIKIYLPRHHGAEESTTEASETDAPEAVAGETILVCEDDEDVRAYSVESLRELGYQVIEARDGSTALRMLAELDGRIDMLFTDVVLPGGMTGAVLAKRALEIHPGLKVLFTTGYARNAIVHHGRLDPGVELLSKPYSYADLAARIRDILDQT